jgi:hypothetical protein
VDHWKRLDAMVRAVVEHETAQHQEIDPSLVARYLDIALSNDPLADQPSDPQFLMSTVEEICQFLASQQVELPADLDQRLERLQTSPRHAYVGNAVAPEVIEAAINIGVFVGGAVVSSWVQRADNALLQAFLRRRRNGRRPTPTQIINAGRWAINLQWPVAINSRREPDAMRIGRDAWSVGWVVDGTRYTASGDDDLHGVDVSMEKLTP